MGTQTVKKFDGGKPDISIIPPEYTDAVAQAFMDGEKKYGRYNYRGGMEWSRLLSAALRHINAFNKGEDVASDSGVHHLGHAGACLAMLMDYYINNLGTENRRPKNNGDENGE